MCRIATVPGASWLGKDTVQITLNSQSTSNESNSASWNGLHPVFPSNLLTKVSGFLNNQADFRDMQSAIFPDDMQKVLAWLGHPPGRSCPSSDVFKRAGTRKREVSIVGQLRSTTPILMKIGSLVDFELKITSPIFFSPFGPVLGVILGSESQKVGKSGNLCGHF